MSLTRIVIVDTAKTSYAPTQACACGYVFQEPTSTPLPSWNPLHRILIQSTCTEEQLRIILFILFIVYARIKTYQPPYAQSSKRNDLENTGYNIASAALRENEPICASPTHKERDQESFELRYLMVPTYFVSSSYVVIVTFAVSCCRVEKPTVAIVTIVVKLTRLRRLFRQQMTCLSPHDKTTEHQESQIYRPHCCSNKQRSFVMSYPNALYVIYKTE